MQNEITSFDTVEDFWSLYNHIRVASELKQGNDYSLFKKNIRPMWEDAGNVAGRKTISCLVSMLDLIIISKCSCTANKRGGRWVLNLNKQQRRNELDALWLDIVSVDLKRQLLPSGILESPKMVLPLQLLCLIGESFEYSDDINGAVVNIRPRGDKICKS